MKLINCCGHLFTMDENRYCVDGQPVIFGSTEEAMEYARRFGHELIDAGERRAAQDAARQAFVGPPEMLYFEFSEVSR